MIISNFVLSSIDDQLVIINRPWSSRRKFLLINASSQVLKAWDDFHDMYPDGFVSREDFLASKSVVFKLNAPLLHFTVKLFFSNVGLRIYRWDYLEAIIIRCILAPEPQKRVLSLSPSLAAWHRPQHTPKNPTNKCLSCFPQKMTHDEIVCKTLSQGIWTEVLIGLA